MSSPRRRPTTTTPPAVRPGRPALALIAVVAAFTGLSLACGRSSGDEPFSRYLEANSRPADPSARVQFGTGRLPSDFPAGLPVAVRAKLLGWERTTTDSAYSWEAAFEAPGAVSAVVETLIAGLKSGGWQVTDTQTSHGFQALNITGGGANAPRNGVISVGPAVTAGRVAIVEEIGEDR